MWQFDTERVCNCGRVHWLHLHQRRLLRCELEAKYTPKSTGHTLLPQEAGVSFCLSLVSVFLSSLPSVGGTTGCPSGKCCTLIELLLLSLEVWNSKVLFHQQNDLVICIMKFI
jgi:hypothetical protein